MIIQFAFYNPAPGSGQMEFNFPIAFTNACIAICAENIVDNYIGISNFFSVTKTSFRVDSYRGSFEKVPFSMIAIGY